MIQNYLKINFSWKKELVSANILAWKHRKYAYEFLPFFTLWEIWKARNASLFSNLLQRLEISYAKIISSVLEWHSVKPAKTCRDLSPLVLLSKHHMILFDGASTKGICGSGFVLKLAEGEEIKGWINTSRGTNTRAEIIGLWSGLYVARWRGLREIFVAGDSQVIIN